MVALKSDGTVVAWGDNFAGKATPPAGLSGVTAIAAGGNHSVALVGSGATAPTFTLQPVSQTVAVGANVTFSAGATGLPAPAYQWLRAGTNLPNATSASLVLTNVTTNQSGLYTVAVSNAAGSVTSAAAMLTVASSLFQPPPPQTAAAIQNSGFQLDLMLEVGRPFRVQATTNLLTWSDLTNFVSSGSALQFLDAAATNQIRRFYRVVSP